MNAAPHNMKPLVRRSPKWPALRRRHLKSRPRCECCGGTEGATVHHKIPVNVDPSRELDPYNLITLCEGDTCNCHLWCGHLGHWRSWNEHVDNDAAAFFKRVTSRPWK